MKIKFIFVAIFFILTLQQAQEYVGIIKPIDNIELSVSIDGKIEEIFIREGSSVKIGDKLLQIDANMQKLEMKRSEIIWKDTAQLNSSKKTQKILKSLLKSTRTLYRKTKSISRDDMQTLEMRYYAQEGDIQARIENEKKEKTEYYMALERLSKYTILSPINGVIAEVSLQEGEWAKMGDMLIRVVNSDICFLEINIDEQYSSLVSVGDELNFNLLINDTIKKIEGKITFISPIADNSSGLVRIKIEFDNKIYKITPGISATVNIDKKAKL
jgi:HlyD family secretion protein